MQSLKGVIIKE